MATVGTVIIDVKADTAKLVSGMDKAEKSIKKTVGSIQTAIISMATAYVGVQGVKAFSSMINDSLDAADATGKLSQKLGLTTDKLSEYQYAAGFAAVSNGELNAGLSALIRRLNNFERDGGGAAKKAFGELGISADYAREHFTTTDIAFEEILKRLEEMPDGFKKTAIAQDIFSKSASGILKLTATDLQNFSEEARKIGVSIPQGVYEMAAAYHDQMDQLDARMKGIKQTVAFSVVAPMNAASQTAVEMYDSMFGEPIDKMKHFEDVAVTIIGNVAYSVGFIKDAFRGIDLVIKSLELVFYGFATGVSLALEPTVDKLNTMIEAYNSFADFAGLNPIDFKLKSSLPDNISKVKELTQEIAKISKELENGRITADEFMNKFKSNLVEIKKEAKKTKEDVTIAPYSTTSEEDFNNEWDSWVAQDDAKEQKLEDDQQKKLARNKEWIASLKEFYTFDPDFDEPTKKADTTFEDWGKTLNSSISNALVDALTNGDIGGAIESLASSVGASMLQASTANILKGGDLLSLGGLGGVGIGLGVSAVSSIINKPKGKSPQDMANESLARFNDELKKTTRSMTALGNVGTESKTTNIEVDKRIEELKTTISSTKDEIDRLNGNFTVGGTSIHNFVDNMKTLLASQDELDMLIEQKANTKIDTISSNIDFSGTSVADARGILGDYGTNKFVEQYKFMQVQMKDLAIEAKQNNGELSAESEKLFETISGSELYEVGQNWQDLFDIIDGSIQDSKESAKEEAIIRAENKKSLHESRLSASSTLNQYVAQSNGVYDNYLSTQLSVTDGFSNIADTLGINFDSSAQTISESIQNASLDTIATLSSIGLITKEQANTLLQIRGLGDKNESNTDKIEKNTHTNKSYEQFVNDYLNKHNAQNTYNAYKGLYGGVDDIQGKAGIQQIIAGAMTKYPSYVSSTSSYYKELGLLSNAFGIDGSKYKNELYDSSYGKYAGDKYKNILKEMFKDLTDLDYSSSITSFADALDALGNSTDSAANALDDFSTQALDNVVNSFDSIISTTQNYADGLFSNNASYNGGLYRRNLNEAIKLNSLIGGGDYTSNDVADLSSALSDASSYGSKYFSKQRYGQSLGDYNYQRAVSANQFLAINENITPKRDFVAEQLDELKGLRADNKEQSDKLVTVQENILAVQQEIAILRGA